MAIKTYVTPPSGRLEYRLEGGVTDVCPNGFGDSYKLLKPLILIPFFPSH
ncbi:hypothetical protein PN499_29190 [Kamptonema animale CS-326]|nr:hypothetical protein [Kamptonema animale]MDB9515281.1 hypothetical protein [Kamptonema animale CS-326]